MKIEKMKKMAAAVLAAGLVSLPFVPGTPVEASAPVSAVSAALPQEPVIRAGQKDEIAIRQLLKDYAAALRAESAEQAAALYTRDGVVISPGAPVAAGNRNVEINYENTFKAIGLDLDFTIHEITVIDHQYAIVRSTSRGMVTVHANNTVKADDFRELFVMQKEQGTWKIARYAFNQDH